MHIQSIARAVILYCSCCHSALHALSSLNIQQRLSCCTYLLCMSSWESTQAWAKNESNTWSGVNLQLTVTFITSKCKRKAAWVLFWILFDWQDTKWPIFCDIHMYIHTDATNCITFHAYCTQNHHDYLTWLQVSAQQGNTGNCSKWTLH